MLPESLKEKDFHTIQFHKHVPNSQLKTVVSESFTCFSNVKVCTTKSFKMLSAAGIIILGVGKILNLRIFLQW